MSSPASHWNYRLVTWYDKTVARRFYGIRECYYTAGKLSSYTEKNDFFTWEDLDDVLDTYLHLQEVFGKPIVDLDNFPKDWPIKKGPPPRSLKPPKARGSK